LLGEHQLANATTAVAVAELLPGLGVHVTEEAIAQGLHHVHWPGRLEVLSRVPFLVVDGAHNGDSARKLVAAIEDLFPYGQMILIFGALAGHSVPDMLDALLPAADTVILTHADRLRAVATSDLLREVYARHREAEVIETVAKALERALALARPDDLICATGSLSIVTEVREAWAGRQGVEMMERDP
jgi:dihydrofolate synthase/folylpolyglutamate synthase